MGCWPWRMKAFFFFLFLQKLEKLDKGEKRRSEATRSEDDMLLVQGEGMAALQDCHQDIDLCQEEQPQDLEKYVMTPFIFQIVGSQ